MNKKTCIVLTIGTTLAFLPSVSSAGTIKINDTTYVMEGHSRSSAIVNWTDIIGDPTIFSVDSVDVTIAGSSISVGLNTNFSGQHSYTTQSDNTTYWYYISDFFIDTNKDGNFDYGIILQDRSAWTESLFASVSPLATGLYSITEAKNSSYFYEEASSTSTGGIGYGEWSHHGMNVFATPVAVTAGNLLAGFTTTRGSSTSIGSLYSYSFNFDSSLIGTDTFDFFWAGATCSNDAVSGTVVPEPGTIMLMSGAFATLLPSVIRRKNRKNTR